MNTPIDRERRSGHDRRRQHGHPIPPGGERRRILQRRVLNLDISVVNEWLALSRKQTER